MISNNNILTQWFNVKSNFTVIINISCFLLGTRRVVSPVFGEEDFVVASFASETSTPKPKLPGAQNCPRITPGKF